MSDHDVGRQCPHPALVQRSAWVTVVVQALDRRVGHERDRETPRLVSGLIGGDLLGLVCGAIGAIGRALRRAIGEPQHEAAGVVATEIGVLGRQRLDRQAGGVPAARELGRVGDVSQRGALHRR